MTGFFDGLIRFEGKLMSVVLKSPPLSAPSEGWSTQWISRSSWRLLRAAEFAEGNLAVLPWSWKRYGLVVAWCLLLGSWLGVLLLRRRSLIGVWRP